jgi:hypothetical protein
MRKSPELQVMEYRKRYYVCAGVSRLSKGYKTSEEAFAELEKNDSYYAYWAGSLSVSVENSPKKTIYIK